MIQNLIITNLFVFRFISMSQMKSSIKYTITYPDDPLTHRHKVLIHACVAVQLSFSTYDFEVTKFVLVHPNWSTELVWEIGCSRNHHILAQLNDEGRSAIRWTAVSTGVCPSPVHSCIVNIFLCMTSPFESLNQNQPILIVMFVVVLLQIPLNKIFPARSLVAMATGLKTFKIYYFTIETTNHFTEMY